MKAFDESVYDFLKRDVPIAWLVLTISLVATAWSWLVVKQISQQQIKSTIFDYRVERIKNNILNRMFAYQQILEGGAGLFAASVTVERYEWQHYVEKLHLDKYYPGIQGVGFSKRILPQDKAAHIATTRAEGGFFQNYAIRPEGEREEYTSIIYLEPTDKRNLNAIGYDMFSEPVRRKAMERARDTGEPSLSGKVTLVQEIDQNVQAGFLIYVPIYQNEQPHGTIAEKRTHLVGYVYSPFRMNDLMRGIFGSSMPLDINLHIYDGDNTEHLTDERFMYGAVPEHCDKHHQLNYIPQFTRVETITVAGHPWTLRFDTLPTFDTVTETYTAPLVLFGGLIISFLLFGVTRSLEISHALMAERQANIRLQMEIHERHQAEKMLRERETELNEAQRIAHVGSWSLDIATGRVFWTEELYRMFGLNPALPPPDYALHQQLLMPESWKRLNTHLEHTIETGIPYELELQFIRTNGKKGWMLAKGEALKDERGTIFKLRGMAQDITERKLAEIALRQRETELKESQRMARVACWSLDMATNRVFWTEELYKMLHWNPELPPPDYNTQHTIFTPDSWEKLDTHLSSLTQDGVPYEVELEFIRTDGSKGWMLVCGEEALRNEQDVVVKLHGMAQDITERKHAELALRESEERFDLAMRGSNDGLWDWNLVTNEVYRSPRFREMLGFDEHLMGSQLVEFSKLIHPDDNEYLETTVAAYLNKQLPKYETMFRMQHKDGHYLWILARGFAVWNAEGKPIRMVGTHTDLTALKQAEEALKQSEEKYRQIVETSQEGIWIIDTQANTTYVNARMANMLGYSEAEMIGKPLFDFMDDIAQQEATRYFERRRQGFSDIHDFRFRRKDNSDFWAIVSTTVMTGKEGHFEGSLAMITDINQRKKMELDLEQAKETAEVANRAKSMFLANMSHELRTPLNGILGFAQILSYDSSLTAKQKQSIHIIEKSGEYLLTLINDILDLAKVEAGKIELSPTLVNLERFLEVIIQLFQLRAEKKGICFSYRALSELPVAIYVDEKRLQQILINLLSNAVKFTEQGIVTLKATYEGEKLCFQIEDQGCGIETSDLEKIFLPFQQVGDRKYWKQGTGLGLSITKKLVETMNGELSVTSTVGIGSTFSILLKLPQVPNVLQIHGESQPPKIIGYRGHSRTILIIDDNWMDRSVLVTILDDLGFLTIEANDGQTAVSKAQTTPAIDLILIDSVTPDIDGLSVIQQLKQIPHCQKTIFIVVSANVFENDRQKKFSLGSNDFIAKPIKFDSFLERLRVHLNLDWIYENHTDPPVSVVHSVPEPGTVKLSSEQANTLFDLAKRGDIRGLLKFAEELETADIQLSSITQEIYQAARQFKIKRILEIAKLHCENQQ